MRVLSVFIFLTGITELKKHLVVVTVTSDEMAARSDTTNYVLHLVELKTSCLC
jgi:hypothetical protein